MIRFTLILLLLTIKIFAADMASLNTLYDNQDYQKLIKEAKLSFALYNDPKLHLIWAQSEQALGNDIGAMNAYERVLMLEPNNLQAQVALVSLYKKLGRESLSQELRATLANQELSPSVRAALAVAYDDFENQLKLKAQLSLGFDSNIGANSDLEFSDNVRDETLETLFSRALAHVNYVSYLSRNWFWQIDAALQAQNNFDASYYNLFNGIANLGLGYRNDIFTFYVPLTYDRMYYFERDFLQEYGVHPTLNFVLSKQIVLNLNAKYLQRRFIDAIDESRDDDVLGSSLSLFYYFNQGFFYATGGYDTYTSQNESPMYFTNKQITYADIGFSSTLDSYIFRADYHYRYSDFDDLFQTETEDENKRSDNYHRIDLKSGMNFYDSWTINLEYSFTKNDSKYNYASYDKHVIMTSLQYSY